MLHAESLEVSYGANRALAGVSLDVPTGHIVAIMGESGSGKTTLLRVVAGLTRPDTGRIFWQQRDITALPPHLRHFGLMFQDYALFPHLTVGGNIAFGLRMQDTTDSDQETTVERLLDLVGLAGYAERSVAELSGGEQQRVALARTLAPKPHLVLLDEPLGALDRARRDQLLGDMQRIFAELAVTALYVTHDHGEAFAIADRVAVLDAGRMVADAVPSDLWSNPGHVAVATLLGFPVLRDIAVRDGVGRLGGAAIDLGLPAGTYHLAVPPGTVAIDPAGPLEGNVAARRFEDGKVTALFDVAGVEVAAEASPDVALGPARARIDTSKLVVVID